MNESLTEISSASNYWFVRTDGGQYFDEYVNNNYIGIGWNEILISDFRNLSETEIRNKISAHNNWNPDISKQKSKISGVYNKIKRFEELKKGDFIVIPSNGSTRLAFGEIKDDQIYPDIVNIGNCPYYKRRSVRWFVVKHTKELDPKFYEIKSSRHSISNIDRYQDYIDRVTSTFYFKDNYGNLVFDVLQDEDIGLIDLVNLISGLQTTVESINQYFNLGEEVRDSAIKLNLQSKGVFALKYPDGKSLAIMGLLIALSSCGSVDKTKMAEVNITEAAIVRYYNENKAQIDSLNEQMVHNQINKGKIEDEFRGRR